MGTLKSILALSALTLLGCSSTGMGCPQSLAQGDAAHFPHVDVNVKAEPINIGCESVRVEYTDPRLLHPLQYTLQLWMSAGIQTQFLLVQTENASPLSACVISVTPGSLRPDYDGWASWRGDGSLGCQVEIDSGVIYNFSVLDDNRIYNTLAHEIGHCMRLPHNNDRLSFMQAEGSGDSLVESDAELLAHFSKNNPE